MADWVVYVSEVPSLLRQNNDMAFMDALKLFWKRNHTNTFNALQASRPDVCETVHEEARRLLDRGLNELTREQRRKVQSALNTYEGIRWEELDIDRTEVALENAIGKRNNRTFTRRLTTPEGRHVELKGRVDGVLGDGGDDVLIESKRRVNGFRGPQAHETTQCNLYMDMLALKHCQLVETYDEQQQIHALTIDEGAVARTYAALCKVVDAFSHGVVKARGEDAFECMRECLHGAASAETLTDSPSLA